MTRKLATTPNQEFRAASLRASVNHEQAGRWAEALSGYRAVLDAEPANPDALRGAARAAAALGDTQGAVGYWGRAAEGDPQRATIRGNFAVALLQAGALKEAEEESRIVLAIQPRDMGLRNLLGVIQKRRSDIRGAIATFREGAEMEPTNHSFWYNLGNSHLALGEAEEAAAAFGRAFELQPDEAETVRLYGHTLAASDQMARANVMFARAEKLNPENLRIYASRAAALQRIGASDAEVLAEIEKPMALEPDNLEHLHNKATFLQRRSRFADAAAVYRDILDRDPENLDALLRLGHMLGYSLRKYEEANVLLRQALALRPEDPRCLSALCKSLVDSRYGVESDHIEEAGQVARKLVETGIDLLPHAANLSGIFLRLADYEGLELLGDRSKLMRFWVDRMNVGSLHNQLGRVITREDRLELVERHRDWGGKVEAGAAKTPILRKARPPRGSKVRVGFMSSDLRDHPVAYFALPIFEKYDREQYEIFCYSFYPAPPDRVQGLIQKSVTGFRSMLQATDREIAQRIHDDGIDILFELGGSTRYNRLDVLAYKAAPLQVSWLGYPHSAGLETIDHILVDPYLNPDDSQLLIEKPFIVPESWVVMGRLGFRDIPIEPGLPEDRAGVITFGTMNNPYKYTPQLFALWAETMQRVPNSRFLFVRPEAGAAAFRANVCAEFSRHGIAAERIDFESVRGRHMPHYNRIDIALDTAPHTGGTTTCEALWMGVPTVSLVGPAFFERLSYSNLSNAGLPDLCAFTREQYVEKAAALAEDQARRRDLRHGLRASLPMSPLGDAERWVRNFEATIARTVNQERLEPA